MTETSGHEWKQLAEAARDEQDPKKLIALIHQLNRALDQHLRGLYPQRLEVAN